MNGTEPILPPALIDQITQVVALAVAAAVGWFLRHWTTKTVSIPVEDSPKPPATVDDRVRHLAVDMLEEAGRQKGLLPITPPSPPAPLEDQHLVTYALKPPVFEQVSK